MGKHSGKEDEPVGPFGKGPHPTPEESQKKADDFEATWDASQERAKRK